MDSALFGVSSVLITLGLLLTILASNHLGYRLGLRQPDDASTALKGQTNAIQAAMLGLLALLLGFSFSMALGRFDARSQMVLEEANAIHAGLRSADLLPAAVAEPARARLRAYLGLRIDMAGIDLTDAQGRAALLAEQAAQQDALWAGAVALEGQPGAGAHRAAVGAVLDAFAKREAALHRHVPVVVLMLLFVVFIIAGGLLGYSAGLERRRPFVPTVAMTVLMVLVIFIIIDLDRPRRGVIQVDHGALYRLAERLAERVELPATR